MTTTKATEAQVAKAQTIKIGICVCSARPEYVCMTHEAIATALADATAELEADLMAYAKTIAELEAEVARLQQNYALARDNYTEADRLLQQSRQRVAELEGALRETMEVLRQARNDIGSIDADTYVPFEASGLIAACDAQIGRARRVLTPEGDTNA